MVIEAAAYETLGTSMRRDQRPRKRGHQVDAGKNLCPLLHWNVSCFRVKDGIVLLLAFIYSTNNY